jgi:hypothetical protein
LGALTAAMTLIISVTKFLPSPGAEKYVDAKISAVNDKFSSLEKQQEYLRDKIDQILQRVMDRKDK